MTAKEHAQAAKAAAQGTTFGYKLRPHSPRWNTVMQNLDAIIAMDPQPEPEPEPEPEPTPTGYAPRTHNSTGRADARFCMDSKYGVVRDGAGYIDAKGVRYDENGLDLGGRTNNATNPIPELKGADSMDGLEPCDPYVGPTGRMIGGAAGYPARSFER